MLMPLLIGLAMSFWGSLPIGMINLLVVETTVNETHKKGLWIALVILGLVAESEEVQELIRETARWIATPVLFYLGWKYIKSDGRAQKKAKEKKPYTFFAKNLLSVV